MASRNISIPHILSATSPTLKFDDTLGAAFIGLLIAAILFGITNVQAYTYFQRFSKQDSTLLKFTIVFLWLLDALQLALIAHVLYTYLVSNFTNILIIIETTPTLCAHIVVTQISDFTVRLFFSRRVWTLSVKNKLLTIATLLLSLTVVVSGLWVGIVTFTYTNLLQLSQITWLFYVNFGVSFFADIWVAFILCYFLMRRKTGFETTDGKVNTLMIYIINTGMLTGLCTAACFLTFTLMPVNYIFIGINFSLSKLYFNSLLATLNTREIHPTTTNSITVNPYRKYPKASIHVHPGFHKV